MWRLGALTATPSLAAATSFLTADVLQHHVLARRGAVAFSALVSTIATIVLMFQNRFGPIIALRSVIGLSLGAKASIISPWLGELAPPRYRGRILATWQIGTSIGIFFGYVCWYIVDHYLGGTKQSPEIRWKIQSALPLITTIPLIFTAYMVPESYIYLLKTRKYKKAMESAHAYAPGKIKGYGNMITSHFQMISKTKDKNTLCPPQDRSTAERTDTNSGSTPGSHGSNDEGRRKAVRRLWKNVSGAVSDFRKEWDRGPNDCQHSYHRKDWDFYKRLFRVVIRSPRCRNAFISCGLVMVAQAAGGINAFALLSSLQIPSVGARGEQAAEQLWNRPTIWALSFGSVNCACSFFTLLVTDKWGRTTLVLIGLPLMAILMGILTVVFATVDDNLQDDNLQDLQGRTIGSWVVMLAFTAIYSISLGPAAFSFPAESFPSSVRESGMAACVALNMLSLGLQLLLYPIISSHIDYWKSLLIYTCVNIAAFILCFLFCVDTKNKSLDDLQYSFKQSLWHHARYRFYVLGRLLRLKFSSPDYEDWSRAQSSSN
ncbi:MFS general substrate transporter [Cenococcum geophilum 1.58]|uniref:MFS general substrate transporter n=1 Tax=Cenococcum geophilum 1.58 TaxID=794803 RepID=UPI00358F5B22|nr:MFS general substrate transporter [Cenococcum geophilum 1.58]